MKSAASVNAILDEHLLCERHLEIWQTFRAVENPSWDIHVIAQI